MTGDTKVRVRKRYDGIQALRFVAALLVVVTHSTLYTAERLDDSLGVWYRGAIGVDIFFMISGFVMIVSTTGLVGRADGWKFFGMRRLIRIVPMYWIATTAKLATMLVVPVAVLHAQLDPAKVALSYFFLPSRNAEGDVHPFLGVGWTLTFEMAFYFIFTIALLLRSNPMWFCAGALSLLALGNTVRPSGDDWWPGLVYLDPIVLYFLAGMAIGQWALTRRTGVLAGWLAYTIGLWFVLEVATSGFSVSGFGQLGWRVAVVAIVFSVVALEPIIGRRIPRWVIYLGAASYSLYLFHPLIAPIVPEILDRLGLSIPIVSILLSVTVAVVMSAIIYRFIERPLTRWLEVRLPYVHPHEPGTVEAAAAQIGPNNSRSARRRTPQADGRVSGT